MENEGGFSSLRALWALRDDAALSAVDWRVAVALLSFADAEGNARPSVLRVAALVGTSPGAVRRSLARLEAHQGRVRLAVERGRLTESGDPAPYLYLLSLQGVDQADGTPDHTDRTPDQGTRTPGSQEPHPLDQADGTPGSHRPTKRISEEDTKKRTGKRRAASRWTRCPEGWQPGEGERALAAELGLDINKELAKFRDTEYARPKSDAAATFRNFMRGNSERAAGGGWGGKRDKVQPGPVNIRQTGAPF